MRLGFGVGPDSGAAADGPATQEAGPGEGRQPADLGLHADSEASGDLVPDVTAAPDQAALVDLAPPPDQAPPPDTTPWPDTVSPPDSGGTTTCAHSPCVTGGWLDQNCDPCVTITCNLDLVCCYPLGGFWDVSCINSYKKYCSCP